MKAQDLPITRLILILATTLSTSYLHHKFIIELTWIITEFLVRLFRV